MEWTYSRGPPAECSGSGGRRRGSRRRTPCQCRPPEMEGARSSCGPRKHVARVELAMAFKARPRVGAKSAAHLCEGR